MIKFKTIEGRVVYVNRDKISYVEVSSDRVYLHFGADSWVTLNETEDTVVEKLGGNNVNIALTRTGMYDRL